MPAAAGAADVLVGLSNVHSRSGHAASCDEGRTPRHERPVLVANLRPDFGGTARAVVIGLASHAYAGIARARIECGATRGGQPRAALLERAPPIGGDQSLDRLDQRRQRRFGIRRDRDVDFGVALEVLVVGLQIQIAGGDADDLRAGLRQRPRRAVQLIAERVDDAPKMFADFEPRR